MEVHSPLRWWLTADPEAENRRRSGPEQPKPQYRQYDPYRAKPHDSSQRDFHDPQEGQADTNSGYPSYNKYKGGQPEAPAEEMPPVRVNRKRSYDSSQDADYRAYAQGTQGERPGDYRARERPSDDHTDRYRQETDSRQAREYRESTTTREAMEYQESDAQSSHHRQSRQPGYNQTHSTAGGHHRGDGDQIQRQFSFLDLCLEQHIIKKYTSYFQILIWKD